MLESLVDVLLPHRSGILELPEWYGDALFAALAKGAMHKYIKRVPKPGGGYRYFYTVGGGGGVHHADHFVEGASFKHEGGHYHIAKTEGDTVHLRHDESGETKKVSKAELGAMLAKHHEAGLKAHREKAAARLAEARANKASPKQIARLEAQAKAADTQKPTRSVHPDAKKALHDEAEYHERSGSVPSGSSDDDYKDAHRMNAKAYRLAADGHEDPYYIAEKVAGYGASRARFQQALSAARDVIDRASKEDKKARHAEADRPPDESASAEAVAAWVKDAERKIQQTKGSSYAKELQAQVDRLKSRGAGQAKAAGHREEPKAPTPADDGPARPEGDVTTQATRQQRVAAAYRKHPEVGVLNRRLSELLIARRHASGTSQRVGIPIGTGAPAPTQATRDAARADVARLNEEIRAAAAAVDAALDLAEGKTSAPRAAAGHQDEERRTPSPPGAVTPVGPKDPMQVALDVAKMRAKWREGNEVHERNKRQVEEDKPTPEMPAFDYDQAMSERWARRDAMAAEHRRQRERHLAEADKALKSGDRYRYASHARAADAHMKAEAAQIASRDKPGKGRSDEAELQSRKANAASRVLAL